MSNTNHVNGTVVRAKTPLTAHELVKLQIENENFQLTDDDLRNIDTKAEIARAGRQFSEESADVPGFQTSLNPYETLRD